MPSTVSEAVARGQAPADRAEVAGGVGKLARGGGVKEPQLAAGVAAFLERDPNIARDRLGEGTITLRECSTKEFQPFRAARRSRHPGQTALPCRECVCKRTCDCRRVLAAAGAQEGMTIGELAVPSAIERHHRSSCPLDGRNLIDDQCRGLAHLGGEGPAKNRGGGSTSGLESTSGEIEMSGQKIQL